MSDPLEEIIKEIATKHGIAVSRDDPILILQTMNYRLLQDTARSQQAQLDRYKEELEALNLRWSNDAKGRAERILVASLAAGKDAAGEIMQEAAMVAAATVSDEIDVALSRIGEPLRDAHRIALLNVVAACITMCAAALVLWAALSWSQ